MHELMVREGQPASAAAPERSDAQAKMLAMVKRHRWPLTALGGGKGTSGLAHNVACWVHSIHLESAGHMSLKCIFASSIAACTDLGTESKLGESIDPSDKQHVPTRARPLPSIDQDVDRASEDEIGM